MRLTYCRASQLASRKKFRRLVANVYIRTFVKGLFEELVPMYSSAARMQTEFSIKSFSQQRFPVSFESIYQLLKFVFCLRSILSVPNGYDMRRIELVLTSTGLFMEKF